MSKKPPRKKGEQTGGCPSEEAKYNEQETGVREPFQVTRKLPDSMNEEKRKVSIRTTSM